MVVPSRLTGVTIRFGPRSQGIVVTALPTRLCTIAWGTPNEERVRGAINKLRPVYARRRGQATFRLPHEICRHIADAEAAVTELLANPRARTTWNYKHYAHSLRFAVVEKTADEWTVRIKRKGGFRAGDDSTAQYLLLIDRSPCCAAGGAQVTEQGTIEEVRVTATTAHDALHVFGNLFELWLSLQPVDRA